MNPELLYTSIFVGGMMTLFCVCLLRSVAIHIGLVDTPGGRKRHAHPIPLIGGISMFIGFCFALLSLDISLKEYRGLLAGATILVLLGVVDDFKELSPRVRLLGQFIASFLLIFWGHLRLLDIGNLFSFGDILTGIFAIPLTVLFVLAFVNAMNMIDGNDGLAGSVALVQTLFLAYLSLHFHQYQAFYFLIILSAVLCVYLGFNVPLPWRKHASIFMGDAGSTFLGFILAWFAIALSQIMLKQVLISIGFNIMTIVWMLAYPFYDLMIVTTHRMLKGQSPFKGGRDHLHHLLTDSGLSKGWVTTILTFVSLLLGFIGILLAIWNVSESRQLFIFGSAFIVYWLVSRATERSS